MDNNHMFDDTYFHSLPSPWMKNLSYQPDRIWHTVKRTSVTVEVVGPSGCNRLNWIMTS